MDAPVSLITKNMCNRQCIGESKTIVLLKIIIESEVDA